MTTPVSVQQVDPPPLRRCVFCDGPMFPDRPRDYCLMPECVREGFKPVAYAAVGVHKSIPTILPWREVTASVVAGGRRRP